MRRWTAALATAATVLTACAQPTAPAEPPVEDPVGFDQPAVLAPDADDVVPAPEPPPSPEPAPSPPPSPAPTPSADPPPPVVDRYEVALRWDGIDIRLPSAETEMIGLHQSNHDGARDVDPVEGSVQIVVMESRERGTGLRSAADVVVHPEVELRAPVTGTVKRAGTYTLYCDKTDDFLVIEPDGRPGIEVKLLHIDGVLVGAGDRVVAGETIVAPRPTQLPFASQVDELSGPEDWPHVHLEVVDTSIPDRPNENSGSDDC